MLDTSKIPDEPERRPSAAERKAQAVVAMVEGMVSAAKPLLDGMWKPREDVPALVKIATWLAAASAFGAFGLEHLVEAWRLTHGG